MPNSEKPIKTLGATVQRIRVELSQLSKNGFEYDPPTHPGHASGYYKVRVDAVVELYDGGPGKVFSTVHHFHEDMFSAHFDRMMDKAKMEIAELVRKAQRGETIEAPRSGE